MSVRESYVKQFGEEEARRLELAAHSHGNGINDQNFGSDPFKWAVLIAIGYQCVEVYAECHGIGVAWEDFKRWAKEAGELASHDGDCDYIAAFAGIYNEFLEVK